jgi:predicted esterase
MGVVYKAQDLRLERLVALKFLPPGLSPDQQEKERFIREAKAASALDHPNIGTIHEIAETDDGQIFIVMAYYGGETLKQKIERGPLPIKEAVDIAAQIARGLTKAHSQGIVHRDIKPGNVMVTKDGLVKIIDFGLAKLGGLTKITQTHTTMGTVAYISPEQARGEEVDQRADVWSLSVVLYEMLTGQLPFPGTHAEAIIHAILSGKPKPLKQLRGDAPLEIERIVHRAVEKDLKSRYVSAAEVLKDLSEYQSVVALPEMRLGGWKLLSGWLRQKRVAIPGILILLVLSSLLGWAFHRQAKIRWAREEALPEISRLIDEQQYAVAFALAQQAERYIPADARLLKLWPVMSSNVSIHTTPPQAEVYMKEYTAAKGDWTHLGESPLEKIKVPWGGLRWKVEKKGFATVETVEDVFWAVALSDGGPISIVLDPQGSLPLGMVHIPGGNVSASGRSDFRLQDYWIDQFEVTNKQFRQFVDSGAYQKRKYWKEPFLKDGHTLSWEQAMAEFRDTTDRPGPSTWEAGDYPKGQDDYPVSGVSWYEAVAYAEFTGKSLPTIYHWEYVAKKSLSPYIVPLSNFSQKGLARIGSYQGMSRSGTYDMAGNAKEWCWNEAGSGKRYILGGAWDEPPYMFNDRDALPPFHRSANFGFRCVKYLSKDARAETVTGPLILAARNYGLGKPVSQEVFRAYEGLYAYDKAALIPVIESIDESDENWKQEKISYTPANGNERALAYLFLPRRFAPPYQTIIYLPYGSPPDFRIDDFQLWLIDFIIKSGRAVLCPTSRDFLKEDTPATSTAYKDYIINMSKKLARAIDYLESRSDLDREKVGYYGISTGASYGAIFPAVESRLKVSVLHAGGFEERTRPEVDAINFAPHVTTPVLMLNGRYDPFVPVETSQKPMFRLLGTAQERKRHAIFECGHVIPKNHLIKETLDWLDRYLGPVKRKED